MDAADAYTSGGVEVGNAEMKNAEFVAVMWKIKSSFLKIVDIVYLVVEKSAW